MTAIEVARRDGLVKASRVGRVIVDISLMPKAIARATDSRLRKKILHRQVKVAEKHGMALRQNYNRTASRAGRADPPRCCRQPVKRMCEAVLNVRTRVGGVQREVAE